MTALDLDLLVDIDEIADLEAPAETQRQVAGGFEADTYNSGVCK